MFRNDRLDQNIFVREEALEPYLTYLVPHRFFKLRHEELLHRWSKTITAWKYKYRKGQEGEFDSEWLDKEFRDQYLSNLKNLAMSYADLSARYGLRHRKCVPFRSSRQKAKPDWIQGIPVNLHLSLMSTARLRCLNKEEEPRHHLSNTTSSRLSQTIIDADKFRKRLRQRTVVYARKCSSKRAVYFRLVDEFGAAKVNVNWRSIIERNRTDCIERKKW